MTSAASSWASICAICWSNWVTSAVRVMFTVGPASMAAIAVAGIGMVRSPTVTSATSPSTRATVPIAAPSEPRICVPTVTSAWAGAVAAGAAASCATAGVAMPNARAAAVAI